MTNAFFKNKGPFEINQLLKLLHLNSGQKFPQKKIYNIACDYIVNNTLVRDKIGEAVKMIPIFQDWKYDGWSSEEVYDDIHKKYDKEELERLGELLDEHVDWEKPQSGKGK